MRSSIRSKLRGLRANAGLSMIETVTAFVVAVAAIGGALHIHMRVMDAMQTMREKNLAHEAIVNELETLSALAPLPMTLGEGQVFRSNGDSLAKLHEPVASVDVGQSGTPGLVAVTARVRWVGEHGRLMEQQITTLLPVAEEVGDV